MIIKKTILFLSIFFVFNNAYAKLPQAPPWLEKSWRKSEKIIDSAAFGVGQPLRKLILISTDQVKKSSIKIKKNVLRLDDKSDNHNPGRVVRRKKAKKAINTAWKEVKRFAKNFMGYGVRKKQNTYGMVRCGSTWCVKK